MTGEKAQSAGEWQSGSLGKPDHTGGRVGYWDCLSGQAECVIGGWLFLGGGLGRSGREAKGNQRGEGTEKRGTRVASYAKQSTAKQTAKGCLYARLLSWPDAVQADQTTDLGERGRCSYRRKSSRMEMVLGDLQADCGEGSAGSAGEQDQVPVAGRMSRNRRVSELLGQ